MILFPVKIKCFLLKSLYSISYNSYFKNIDKVVFVGGGLIKYKYQQFWIQISSIVNNAEKNNIPVFFNAVGVEGYSNTDYRCQFLKKYLNKDIVKMITIRNNPDLFFNNYMENKNTSCYEVGDPALFTKETFK